MDSHLIYFLVYFQLAWAPAKGVKDYKKQFDKELGVTYIPLTEIQVSSDNIALLEEGGWIDPRTIPESEAMSKSYVL